MKKITVVLIILAFLNIGIRAELFSQDNFTYSKSPILTSAPSALLQPRLIKDDYKPALQHMEMPTPGGNSYRSFLLRQKEQLPYRNGTRKTPGTATLGDAAHPIVLTGFQGNLFDGSVPPDNHVAISNDGKLISVANSNIIFYDTDDDSLLLTMSLEAFFDTLNLPANKYDPRVLYDPKQDKFIIICLSGNTDSTSHIVAAFSTTNHPMDAWHLYELPGNPLSSGVWSDYPIVALTDEELFITINWLVNDTVNTPDSWKFLFQQSVIWQINKQSGYSGQPLQKIFYDSIFYNNRPIRNLCPIQGGSTTTTPRMYLLSNRNFDVENDTFFILEITNRLTHLATRLKMDVRISDVPYGLAPDGQQGFNRILMTNDSRVLSGYIEDNQIHFVQNSVNLDTLRAAVYHGFIEDVSGAKIVKGAIIGEPHLDFGYPNIAYTGKYPGDDEALITFNHTSLDSFPGFSVVFYDSKSGYSERVTLKTGEDYVSTLFGLRQRWGDYSGSQRKYNEPGKVWAAGFYGLRIGSGIGAIRTHSTWIAAIESPDTSAQPPVSVKPIQTSRSKTYPNPTEDFFTIEFELGNARFLEFSLFDLQGKLVKTLLRDSTKDGRNKFFFSTQPLNPGVYILMVRDGNEVLIQERVVKQ